MQRRTRSGIPPLFQRASHDGVIGGGIRVCTTASRSRTRSPKSSRNSTTTSASHDALRPVSARARDRTSYTLSEKLRASDEEKGQLLARLESLEAELTSARSVKPKPPVQEPIPRRMHSPRLEAKVSIRAC